MTPTDLRDTGRLLTLFALAAGAKLVSGSEVDRLRFLTAAEHALVKGTRNAAGLFMHLVRCKRWHYCTNDDEAVALARLKRHERRQFERDHPPESSLSLRKRSRAPASDEARLAATLLTVAERKGVNPMLLVRAMQKPWTLDELVALAETAEAARWGRLTARGAP